MMDIYFNGTGNSKHSVEYYIVDAFTDEVFKGNPAGVCVLEHEIPKELMQSIATENNLPETAFVYKKEGCYRLRWFTPGFEIDLCGHATLAAAYVMTTFVEPERKEISFETMSGTLKVVKKEELYEMSFPKRIPEKIELTHEVAEALGFEPLEVYSERDLYVVVQNEQQVRNAVPDYEKLEKLKKWLGIAVTAPGTEIDFVSRYFCPELQAEDPVTGSSHSSLIPLWQEKTGKTKFTARQLSKRGGTLYCEAGTDEVKISGKAVLYLKGQLAELK